MPSQLKMNLVCVAKAAKIKMKKKWIRKINKITKKPSCGSFVKQTVGTGLFNLTWKRRHRIHFILHVVVISGTDPRDHCRNIFYIAETTAELSCLRANFPLQFWLYSNSELFPSTRSSTRHWILKKKPFL